ncbi:hypothetical protein TGP89_254700 [Toxoplasma gondii p89]|uniref:Uncharacterized protein n=1 Tax=Toxoplasma gondii p89 TaxID=943119 RepID=A0A086KQK6_TOXGO|nr:hypothetical protein TGP89_254700 [Toxoplasma gondii p89]
MGSTVRVRHAAAAAPDSVLTRSTDDGDGDATTSPFPSTIELPNMHMRTCQEAGDARDLSRSPADDSQTAEERIGEWPNARRRRVESRGTSNWTAVYGTSSSADSVPLCDQMFSGASRSPVVVLSGQPAALAERSPAKNRDPPDVVIVTSDEDVVEEAYCLVSDDEVVITGTSQGGTRAPRSESVAGADRVNSRPLNGQHYRTWRERFSSSLPVQSGAAGEAPTFYPLHIPGRRSDVRSLTEAPSEPVVAGAADGLPRRSTGSRPSDQADARAFLRRTPGRRQQGHAYHHGVEACQAPGLFQQLKEADRCLARARVTVQRLRQAENELFRERRELEQRHNQAVWRPQQHDAMLLKQALTFEGCGEDFGPKKGDDVFTEWVVGTSSVFRPQEPRH